MEFFLPGLAALLIAALLVFLILPRMGAPMLAALSIALLVYGVWSHVTLFHSEYRYSTWQEKLKFYAPFVMIAALIIAVFGYIGFLFSTGGSSALPASNGTMSPAVNDVVNSTVNTVSNAATNAVNTVSNAATNAVNLVSNAATNAANAVGLGKSKNNKNSTLGNLGRILNTPSSGNRNR